jgi:hypothetical protein
VIGELFAEGHAVQTAQAVVWALSAVLALATASGRRRPLDRAVAGWLGVLAALALVRELDLHEVLHATTPIHFRTRWLLESDASRWWKAGVLGLGLLGAAVVLVPPIALPVPWRTLLRRGDRETWLLLAALGCLAAGYFLDDIVGRWAAVDRGSTKIVEEALELVGAAAFWMCVEGERARPLTTRLPE